MFTGIVEGTAKVLALEDLGGGLKLTFLVNNLLKDVSIGDSISINGVCLTVTDLNLNLELSSTAFSVTAVPETLRLSNLKTLKINSEVNIERSMLANTRIGGHWVQGHIDGTVKILKMSQEGVALNMSLSLPQAFKSYLIHKGFVALDGMSLTIAGISENSFWVTLIPHTCEVSIAKNYSVGTSINFEADMMAKYVERVMEVKYGHGYTSVGLE